MNPSNNSVYFSVFTYNPYVLTRWYQHLTTKASMQPHHIMCVSLDIGILIVRFGDQTCMCIVDTPMYKPSEINSLPFNKSFLAI